MSDVFDLTGRIALVTGSSRGIGAAIARELSRCGARCIINYVEDPNGVNLADAQQVAAQLGGAQILRCDVSDLGQVTAMMDQIAALDILVNNAGILRDKTIKKMTEPEWEQVIRVNLTGTFHCIQQAARILRPDGRIVNLSSANAFMGFFGTSNYAASKAGVVALTKVAARELARQQITVNAIAPGFVDTEMTKTMPPDVVAKFKEQIPLGRFASVDDIAGTVAFLCSGSAKYITGQVIHINGGFLMD